VTRAWYLQSQLDRIESRPVRVTNVTLRCVSLEYCVTGYSREEYINAQRERIDSEVPRCFDESSS
jgi:hypothetical protein